MPSGSRASRPDIVIVDDRTRLDENLGSIEDVIDANLGTRPVYLLRETLAAIPDLAEKYDIEYLDPEDPGLLIHVIGRSAACDRGDARDRGDPGRCRSPPRVPRLSYFFPAHNEEANLEGLVEEALATLPSLAETFEIIAVDDGSKDGTPALADALAARHPGVVRVVHHPVNLGYGAALRSGFAAARFELVAFTDGDRQFKVVDIGRLTARLAAPDAPDVVAGFRIKRADPPIRIAYARAYRLANRVFFGLRVTDVDCACKLFRRAALEGLRVEIGRRVLLRRTAHQAPGRRPDGRRGRRPALPEDRRLADRGQAAGHPPRRPRLLAAPAPHVGEPRSRAPPRAPILASDGPRLTAAPAVQLPRLSCGPRRRGRPRAS